MKVPPWLIRPLMGTRWRDPQGEEWRICGYVGDAQKLRFERQDGTMERWMAPTEVIKTWSRVYG